MSQNKVCGVVVTYEPGEDVAANIAALRRQVSELVIVDNGSSVQIIERLIALGERLHCRVIQNGENLGIAIALNNGVRWAASQGFFFVFLMDQDSLVQDACVTRLINAYHRDAEAGSTGITIPRYIDRLSREVMPVSKTAGYGILTARTSGSLIPVAVFEDCGWFREDLFIDGVDFEYCLRIRLRGYRIRQCDTATLVHSLGNRKSHVMGTRYLFTSTHHNARRRYYITRNRLILIRCYWNTFPRYCLKLLLYTAKDSVKILLVERDKASKAASSVRGVWDGLSGTNAHNVSAK
jgi:rhamnosyltransferase